ncbi:MAG: cysteine synthase family protein [Bacteroidota bacterium]|nr:cysteine synthase family protein [Bacteroidota bacterium]
MIETQLKKIDTALLENALKLQIEVGHTPLYHVKNLFSKNNVQLYAKKEWKQLSGSVKCRPAYNIIVGALKTGELDSKKTLLDATSGNTGIAYATIAKRLGIKVALCLPENASKERKEILRSLGVDVIFTSKYEGTDGAQDVAGELSLKFQDKYFYADQYKNENNWKAHYETTAPEIFSAIPGITHFVAGLGTTGTFVGTGRRLKELNASIHLTSLQPDSALHALEGWKHLETAVVPKIYDPTVAEDNLEVSTEEAYEIITASAKYENLLLSPSSAANIAGALKVIDKIDKGIVVTVLPDNADKYSDIIKKLL